MIRIGHGFDLHQFEPAPNSSILLAGVPIPYHQKIKAHSDGDVVIHAVIDALLGALALGDIGQWFPDDDPTYKNASSQMMLSKVMDKVHEMGYTIGNMDVTIITQKPKLKDMIPLMREALSESIQAKLGQVSIKAKTHEKVDAIGQEKAIAAHVVVLLHEQ